jgi:HSP20 family molecular chaperone IbpA
MKKLLCIAVAIVLIGAGCSNRSLEFDRAQLDHVRSSDEPMVTSSGELVEVDERLKNVNFSETGNITDWDEVTETYVDDWTLTYELPGVPAGSVDLVFDDDSVCVVANEEYDCREILDKEFNGKRLHVQGVEDDTKVSVKRITF